MKGSGIVWLIVSLVSASALGAAMFFPDHDRFNPIDRTAFLPGETTDGHYQIEIECGACHTENLADASTLQAACIECHSAELEAVDDSHPTTKFTDPRNADRVAILDARRCATCHQEHRPEVVSTMGLSLPGDYCYQCHATVADDRPTHRDLPFDSCAAAGCHNFHDNRALYEDFLVEHRNEPDLKPVAFVPLRTPGSRGEGDRRISLSASEHDAPRNLDGLVSSVADWADSAHAAGGVNCSDCHTTPGLDWRAQPQRAVCTPCHEAENETFLAGRHGMRIAAGLSPLTPADSRLPRPLVADSHDTELDCNTCHPAHRYDTGTAATEACLGCHADEHSRAYAASPHAELARREFAGQAEPGSGVTCATCHFPRITHPATPDAVLVSHNQNDFLRPNEKMIRSTCLQCHGLAFSIDSLADPALIQNNFRGRPHREVESIHFASVLRWELEGRDPPWTSQSKEEKNEKDE